MDAYENLVELHSKLEEFAKHHQNLGIQQAYGLIEYELITKVKDHILDGSKDGVLINQGRNEAIKQVLDILQKAGIGSQVKF